MVVLSVPGIEGPENMLTKLPTGCMGLLHQQCRHRHRAPGVGTAPGRSGHERPAAPHYGGPAGSAGAAEQSFCQRELPLCAGTGEYAALNE